MWEDSQIWDQHWGQGSHHVDDHPLGQLWGEPLAALRLALALGLAAAAAAAEEARRALAA